MANRAGVGNATPYRHFPTREDLLEEFYRDRIRPLREDARTLLATESPAWALHARLPLRRLTAPRPTRR
ncbi:TetR/AcrR family transcriptional regulator [Streptomyces sp. NBC_01724]|uniref:TetR/AcrR family transcriptional regulator n=1 Tax=unclassified Streptomyces TaxID=2593676 RepID=UPI002E34742F|nr:hypothetical protein [Streptomyces sp. NBC_01724]WTE57258.1 TetR/AcrR family transcriptional regulator [Streptomyces sp. NBC_01620]WTE65309.1 TetR/AcrR family transcriptional regulator [Streptomyces sp. NBC_01617]WTI92677.1 TetR/AcrR family transcriptional regulator [Streptomyces sp. NBC_00724]